MKIFAVSIFDRTINIMPWKLFIDTTGDGNISSGKNSPEVLTHIDRQGKCFKYTYWYSYPTMKTYNSYTAIQLQGPFKYTPR